AEARGVQQRVIVEHRCARPAQRVDPILERKIFEKAPHRGQLEMRVSVDQARKQYRIAKLDIVARRCLAVLPDESNDAILTRHNTVLDRRRSYGENPACAITNQQRTVSGDASCRASAGELDAVACEQARPGAAPKSTAQQFAASPRGQHPCTAPAEPALLEPERPEAARRRTACPQAVACMASIR